MSEFEERLGAALSSRYELEREIGRGGMAVVYLARDVKQGRQVALKVFQPDIAAAMGPARFRREIELATRLEHPHILSLYDSGEADGLLYYVMPFVSDGSLRDRLEREGQLPIEAALRIAREMAEGLDFAHEQGVVHRDVKPGNVLLQRGHAQLADFGVARALESSGAEKLTGTGVSVGTPQYMAPEQATGAGAVDGRSDVYAVGAVLYEMLTGEPPYTGPTPQAVLAKRMAGPPTPVPVLRETVPSEVDGIVQQAMARSAADRWQSAGDLAKALAAAERGSGTPIPGLATWPGVTGEVVAPAPERKRAWPLWAGAAVVLLVALGGLWLSNRGASDEAVATIAAPDLPESDLMLVLVVPERPANDAEWIWTGILADRVKNLGDLEVVDRRELQSALLEVPVLATSAADSIAASVGASRLVLVGASELGEELRLNLSLYETGTPTRVVSELDTTVSRLGHEAWAPASVVRLFAGQETGLAGEARTADLNTGLAKPEAEIWASKGLSYWTRGKYDSALVAYQRAVAEDSMYLEGWKMLSRSAGFSAPFQQERRRELQDLAGSAWERYLALGGEVDGDERLPLDEARRAVAASPDNPQALLALYHALRLDYWKRGSEPDSMIEPLLRSIELDPLHEEKRIALIIYYLCEGDPASLERAYNEAKEAGIADTRVGPLWPALAGLALGPEARRDSILAADPPMQGVITHRLILLQDDMDLVLRVASTLLTEYPGAIQIWSGWALLSGGQWAESVDVLVPPESDDPARREGERRLLLYQGRASPAAAGVLKLPEDEMREIRDELASDEPSLKGHVGFAPPTEVQFVRYHFLGLISARLGDIDGARAYADSLEELPDRADVGDGRVPPADEVVPLAQDLALEVRAQVLVEQGRLEEALGLLERQTFGAISEGDDSGLSTSRTFGRFLRAEILRELGRYEEAVGWYATIPRVKMWHQQDVLLHAPVFRGRAQALDALGRQEEALHYYRRFVTRWQDADPHLQPQVEEARQRIRELERELN